MLNILYSLIYVYLYVHYRFILFNILCSCDIVCTVYRTLYDFEVGVPTLTIYWDYDMEPKKPIVRQRTSLQQHRKRKNTFAKVDLDFVHFSYGSEMGSW